MAKNGKEQHLDIFDEVSTTFGPVAKYEGVNLDAPQVEDPELRRIRKRDADAEATFAQLFEGTEEYIELLLQKPE